MAAKLSSDNRIPFQPDIQASPCQVTIKALCGCDPKIQEIRELVEQVADTDATVLITGESGTGKELVARSLHTMSRRREQPFIAVNCGAIAETLQESELFGHTKGAFTGAGCRKIGKFEAASDGTILLDEISEMSLGLQVKLLRILQSGEYSPVGMAENMYCNARVVAATNQPLLPLVNSGRFRDDLYYRLNIIRLEIPPLRERRSDISQLIEYFFKKLCQDYGKCELQLDAETRAFLLQYDYPGNVRELKNLLQRLVILGNGTSTRPNLLPSEVLESASSPSPPCQTNFHEAKAHAVEEFERGFLSERLQECGGIVSRAAHLSGLSERNFHEKLKKYGLCGKDFRASQQEAA